jgi:hypothetical protein
MYASPQRVPVPELFPSTTSVPTSPREAPFVRIPTLATPLAADDRDALEPHWHSAIDAATD